MSNHQNNEIEPEINPLYRKRRSVYAFSDRDIDHETMRRLFEAARWAPSCKNDQPWSFIAVSRREEPDQHATLLQTLSPNNQLWAKKAPVLMFSVVRYNFADNGEANRHALHDVGLATGNMIYQAVDMGLNIHTMAAFDYKKVAELVGIPKGSEALAAIVVGYPGDAEDLPKDLRQRQTAPKTRRALDQFVFSARWGEASPLLQL